MKLNLPTTLTLVRIALIPVVVAVYYIPWKWSHILCAAIFSIAAITDWLDGYLARRLKQATRFGAFLDPVADKLMVAVVLVMIVQSNPSPLMAIPAAVIIGREITIASLREWMAEIGERNTVKVSWVGKIKTTAQMIAIITLLLATPGSESFIKSAGYLFIYIAAILTLWSMVQYLRASIPSLLKNSN